MKTHTFIHSIMAALLVAATASADDSVTLKAEVKSSTDRVGKSEERSNDRHLEITATAFHLAAETSVKIDWTLFGDDLERGNIVKKGEGSETVQLSQSKSALVKTKAVVFSYTPRHSERTGSGRSVRFKTVDATGVRYHGWILRAYVGDKLVGQAVSNNALIKLLEKGS